MTRATIIQSKFNGQQIIDAVTAVVGRTTNKLIKLKDYDDQWVFLLGMASSLPTLNLIVRGLDQPYINPRQTYDVVSVEDHDWGEDGTPTRALVNWNREQRAQAICNFRDDLLKELEKMK